MSGKDDRKMKELADRLVAMSPEPPPFPEEVSVTQREESKPRPVLVFAGAALVVLLLAAIPIFLARGGGQVDPVASSSTTRRCHLASPPSPRHRRRSPRNSR